ncbi:MAG: hypothetical protein ACYC3L_13765 [Gemmatimonadaceae bacterium]
MLASALRATVAMLVISAPVLAQTTLGPYSPVEAKYRVISNTTTSQVMMGQAQEFETKANQLLALSVKKAGDALSLTMTLDSATVTTTAPQPAPDMTEALGMKFAATMGLDGKVATSAVTDRTGAPSMSQLAGNFRTILPRLLVGATVGATWTDSSSNTTKQEDAEVVTSTTSAYSLAGDTLVAGVKAWKITATSISKVTGHGNRMGADYTITGDVKGLVTAVVSTAGVLLGEASDADSNLTVTVESAGMTIPIAQKTSTRIDRLP